jgi:streptogramin lyase
LWIMLVAAAYAAYAQSLPGSQASPLADSPDRAIQVSSRSFARQLVRVYLIGCADCAFKPPGVSIWDESINAPIPPKVSGRTNDGFTLSLAPGYYDVNVRSTSCNGERFLGVLPHHDRFFELRVRCVDRRNSHILGYVRLTDAARGLAGTAPPFANAIAMWPADGDERPVAGTLDGGAYYFDEVNCSDCVLEFSLTSGKRSRIGVSLHGSENFSLVRHDVTDGVLLDGVSVRGSPFNAPETLVEGPSQSIWILDRLGNRVDVISPRQPPREIDLPSPFANAGDIIATSRFVWVSERRFDRIVRFALDGSYKEYQVTLAAGGFHGNLEMASGGNDRIWFIDGRELGALDEKASPRYFVPSPVFGINALAIGGDGRIWVSGAASSYGLGKPFLAAVTMDGQWQRFPLVDDAAVIKPAKHGLWVTTGNYDNYLSFVSWEGRETLIKLSVKKIWPTLYAVGAADDVWFSDRYGNVIGHATPDGSARLEYTDFGPPGISDMRLDPNGNLWVAERKAHVIDEYGRAVYLPPHGVFPKSLLFDSSGNLWYSDPDADVVGVVAKSGRSNCYAFRLSRVKNCAFGHAEIIAPPAAPARPHRAGER